MAQALDIQQALQDCYKKELVQNFNKLKPCPFCGCEKFEIKHAINSNGMDCYPYFCRLCGNRSPIVEKKSVAINILNR